HAFVPTWRRPDPQVVVETRRGSLGIRRRRPAKRRLVSAEADQEARRSRWERVGSGTIVAIDLRERLIAVLPCNQNVEIPIVIEVSPRNATLSRSLDIWIDLREHVVPVVVIQPCHWGVRRGRAT